MRGKMKNGSCASSKKGAGKTGLAAEIGQKAGKSGVPTKKPAPFVVKKGKK